MYSTKIALLNLGRRRSRTVFTLLAIAVAVAMTILMTATGLGLKAGSSAMYAQEVDYWIVPSGSGATDPITNSEQTMLGRVHQNIERIIEDPDVNGASPILNRVLYASDSRDGSKPKAIIGIGVIPGKIDVPPVSSKGFTSGDPDDTHEAVVNEKTARLLDVRTGSTIYAGESQTSLQPFTIVNVIAIPEYSLSPVIVLHLSELQNITGNREGDRANQIIVSGGTRDLLKSIYPDAVVLSNTESTTYNITSDKKILATTIAVVSVSILICILFISTTMIMSVTEKQREFAVMRAIGISDATITRIVLCESILLSFIGGIAGVFLSIGGRVLLSEIGYRLYEIRVPMVMPTMLLIAGLGVAVAAGVLSGIFPAITCKRLDITRLER
ncbi:MAG: FtsX-like permease family protein [Euryarchaeota archaeon]|nr:FtsX-like permease family protein [Euryarchaeota archaeon]